MADPRSQTKRSSFDATGVPTRLGRYRLEKLLGRGGMAGVYLASDGAGKQVALKVLAQSESQDPVGLERFQLEAELMSRLEHRHIVRVFEFGQAEGHTFLATEYVDGGTVRELAQRVGPMPAALAAEIASQLLTGLSAAHAEGIVHRDLKPENMLLTRGGVMKLVDFGIARLAGQSRLTSAGTVLGTVQYMSPEQAQALDLDPRSDLFSAGTILYELLCGLNPFEGDSAVVSLARVMGGLQTPVSELAPATPPALEAVLDRLLAVDLKARYPSALHALADLEPVLVASRERAPTLLADCVARPAELGVALRAGAARALIAEARRLAEGTTQDQVLAAIKLHGAQVTHPQAGEATELLNRLSQALHLHFGPSRNPKIAELERQLIGKPATTATLIQLAQLHRLEGNVVAAARFYKRAIRLKPTDGYFAGLLLQLTGERVGHADEDEEQPTQMVPRAMLQSVPLAPAGGASEPASSPSRPPAAAAGAPPSSSDSGLRGDPPARAAPGSPDVRNPSGLFAAASAAPAGPPSHAPSGAAAAALPPAGWAPGAPSDSTAESSAFPAASASSALAAPPAAGSSPRAAFSSSAAAAPPAAGSASPPPSSSSARPQVSVAPSPTHEAHPPFEPTRAQRPPNQGAEAPRAQPSGAVGALPHASAAAPPPHAPPGSSARPQVGGPSLPHEAHSPFAPTSAEGPPSQPAGAALAPAEAAAPPADADPHERAAAPQRATRSSPSRAPQAPPPDEDPEERTALLPPQPSPSGAPPTPRPPRQHGHTVLALVGLALVVAVCFDIGLRLRPAPPVVVAPPAPPPPAPPEAGTTQAQAALAEARRASRDGDAAKALGALQGVAAQYPESPEAGEALLQLADLGLVRGQPKDAKRALDAFLRRAPTHPRAAEGLLRRGQLQEELGDPAAAEADYREVLEAHQGSLLAPDAHLRLGLLLKKRHKVKEARDELEVALRLSRAGDLVNRQAFDALLKLQQQ